ncbi:MAG: hypothetical protein JXK07_12225 [Spirochaetes bacterium]|nr:hypothetical protein [Spirochaetota bacterium]MBN2770820.1 hypothetical protein [Spirochaetota bacterium]
MNSLRNGVSFLVCITGAFFAIAGVVSMITRFIGYEVRIFSWLSEFETVTAWLIRAGVIAGGILVYVFGVLIDPER